MEITNNNQNILYVFKKNRTYHAIKKVLIEFNVPHVEVIIGKSGHGLTESLVYDLVNKSEYGFFDIMVNSTRVKEMVRRENAETLVQNILENRSLLSPAIFVGFKNFMYLTITSGNFEEYTPFMEVNVKEMIKYNDRECNYGT